MGVFPAASLDRFIVPAVFLSLVLTRITPIILSLQNKGLNKVSAIDRGCVLFHWWDQVQPIWPVTGHFFLVLQLGLAKLIPVFYQRPDWPYQSKFGQTTEAGRFSIFTQHTNGIRK